MTKITNTIEIILTKEDHSKVFYYVLVKIESLNRFARFFRLSLSINTFIYLPFGFFRGQTRVPSQCLCVFSFFLINMLIVERVWASRLEFK